MRKKVTRLHQPQLCLCLRLHWRTGALARARSYEEFIAAWEGQKVAYAGPDRMSVAQLGEDVVLAEQAVEVPIRKTLGKA